MTPGHTRLVLTGFVVFAVGVALNTTLMQGEPRTHDTARRNAERHQRLALETKTASKILAVAPAASSPGQRAAGTMPFQEPTREETAVRFARLRTDAARPDQLPHAPDAEGASETIRAVQRELTIRNYGPLIADGVPGQVTRAAILAFETDNRLPLTGEATETLLKRIVLGPSGPLGEGTGAGKVRSAHAEQLIRSVQQMLASLGYQPGRVDGRPGEDSERAIRDFEMDQGLVPTGRISAEVFSRLARAVGTTRPAAARHAAGLQHR
jgi:peptidoglycan hydrolase-like protein with peptidoglycan-binding domain